MRLWPAASVEQRFEPIAYKGRLAVALYARSPLSLRNVVDLRHERGIDVTHETVHFWWSRFGPDFAAEILWKGAEHLCAWPQRRRRLYEVFVKLDDQNTISGTVDHESGASIENRDDFRLSTGAKTEGSFDQAHLAEDAALRLPSSRLSLADRAHGLAEESLDRSGVQGGER